MFGFVPSSSLAHVNYDVAFNDAVTLPGGRVMEQCGSCGALILCEYPTLDGSKRGEDPLITYGPGTVYEQCDVESVPLTYRSFRALMASGVTGGVMYSDSFRHNVAKLFKTDIEHIPSWKVVKDAMRDKANVAFDEWWSASIGRNFVVLYENSRVLHPVAAWHRVPHTEIINRDFAQVIENNHDPLKDTGQDSTEMAIASDELVIPDEVTRKLNRGNRARLGLIEQCLVLSRTLRDLGQWAPADTLHRGAELFNEKAVRDLAETRFGIWSADVRDNTAHRTYEVDMLIRHDIVAKINCTCQQGHTDHVCEHMVAMALRMAQRFNFDSGLRLREHSPHNENMKRDAVLHGAASEPARFDHYADAVVIFHTDDDAEAHYPWLTAFINPLKYSKEPLYHVEFMEEQYAGPHRIGYCVYHEVLLNFIDLVITRGDSGYADTLHKYGLEKDVRLGVLNLENMDEQLTVALVTMIVYRERRSEGYLAECVENQTLVRLLEHLRDLDNQRVENQSADE